MYFWYLSAHKYAHDAVVHLVYHVVEQLDTFQLEDYKWVFLFVRCVLYAVFQFVERAEVLLPTVVDDMQKDCLLKLLYNALTFCFVSLFKVARYVVDTLAVCYRHHDALVHAALVLVNLLYNRITHRLDALCLALEACHCNLERLLGDGVLALVYKLLAAERTFHGKHFHEFILASLIVVFLYDAYNAVPNDVRDVHADALAHECMLALFVYNGTLLVHHVVVFEQALTYAEVVFLNLFLCMLDAARNHRALDTVALLKPELVHHACNALACKKTHKLVFKRNIEH